MDLDQTKDRNNMAACITAYNIPIYTHTYIYGIAEVKSPASSTETKERKMHLKKVKRRAR